MILHLQLKHDRPLTETSGLKTPIDVWSSGAEKADSLKETDRCWGQKVTMPGINGGSIDSMCT
jgi:hypothetical protein